MAERQRDHVLNVTLTGEDYAAVEGIALKNGQSVRNEVRDMLRIGKTIEQYMQEGGTIFVQRPQDSGPRPIVFDRDTPNQ